MRNVILFLMIQLLLKLERPFYKFGKLYEKTKHIKNPIFEKVIYKIFEWNLKIMSVFNLKIKELKYSINF